MSQNPYWDSDAAKYPRKSFRRDKWKSLDGSWNFLFDDEKIYDSPPQLSSWPLQIIVPYAPESEASGIGDPGFHLRCWYQREFSVSKTDGKRILLHFGAVDYAARVWLNGQYLGTHEGGYTPFHFDITDEVTSSIEGNVQTLTVCVDDDPADLAKPRGKQDWQREPHSIWYPRTTGIWQHVWLEEVSTQYLETVSWTALLEQWEIGCEAFIGGPAKENMQLKVQLSSCGRILANDSYQVVMGEVHRKIALSDPGIDDYRNELLWSPEKPTLIDAVIELWADGQLLDRVSSYTALRSVSVHKGRFLLNGRPYFLRLVLDQGYWPDTHLTPPSSEALKKDIELTKACGFNGVRKHQKIEDPDFLYWADVLGLLVWAEMPSAYRFTHQSVERLMRQWTEIIDRDMNHPCIVVWVPFNESWGVPDLAAKTSHQHCVQAFYHLTKTLDPTRPCIGNDGWESTSTDIIGIHDYDDQPQRLIKKYGTPNMSLGEAMRQHRPAGRVLTVEGYPHEDQPVMLTEFGGIAFQASAPVAGSWGYSTVGSSADLGRRYKDLLEAVHSIDSMAGFCYTQLTDTFQEENGLLRMDRTPKFPFKEIAKATRGTGFQRGELTSLPQPSQMSLEFDPESEI